jgi:hypothetical protein
MGPARAGRGLAQGRRQALVPAQRRAQRAVLITITANFGSARTCAARLPPLWPVPSQAVFAWSQGLVMACFGVTV